MAASKSSSYHSYAPVLKDRFFMSFSGGETSRQGRPGQVVGFVGSHHVLVDYWELGRGDALTAPAEQRIVEIADLVSWKFYSTEKALRQEFYPSRVEETTDAPHRDR